MVDAQTVKMLEQFNRAIKAMPEIAIHTPERAEFKGKRINAQIVRQGDDIIFQLFMPRFPKFFPALLAETVEGHFGGTTDFKLDHVAELNSYALLAKGILARPTVRVDYVTTAFLNLLDEVLNSPEIKE